MGPSNPTPVTPLPSRPVFRASSQRIDVPRVTVAADPMAAPYHQGPMAIPPTSELSDTMLVLGGQPVDGEIQVRGSKNALPKAMVAALLTVEPRT